MPTEKSTLLQKGSKNRSANPHKLNSRISPIRLFQKVWVPIQTSRTKRRLHTSDKAFLFTR